jgi:hypothetical protein
MNLGAEPKKVKYLAGLAFIGAIVFYMNVFSGPDAPKKAPAVVTVPGTTGTPPNIGRAKVPVRGASREFRPKFPTRPEERANYATVDPALRVDLLAKVQSVQMEGGARSLFQFAAAPPAAGPVSPTQGLKIPVVRKYGPEPPPPPVQPPSPPPPPPITLKFYGYSTPRADGTKRAFFLDGEDIFVAAEGELIKKRYRVVQIGVNSVIMEDTEFKNNRQTLVLQQEQAG